MAIALDTSTTGGTTASSPLTWSHTCTGTNLVLIVTATVDSTHAVSSMSYNSVAMTLLDGETVNTHRVYIYYLIAPATGANTVSVVYTGGTCSGASASYTGVRQSGIPDSNNFVRGSGADTSISASTTTVANLCWVIGTGCTTGGTATAGANTTVRTTSASTYHPFICDSNAGETPPGSFSQALTCASGDNGMIIFSLAPFLTTTGPRYWVGGTGTWDNSSVTHWATSSGGAGGGLITAPSSVNDVFFDGNSGSGTITSGASLACNNFTCTGYTGTFAGSNTLSITSSMTLASGMTLTFTGAITLTSTSSGNTITNASQTILTGITFNGSGGVWTLQDNMTVPSVTNTAGTIVLGSTTVSLTGTGTVWSSAGFITAGTSTIKLTNASSSSKTFSGNGLVYNNLWITGSGTGAYTIVGSNTFNDFKVDTPPHTVNFTAGTTQTLATFTVSGTAGNLMTLQSTSAGTSWFLKQSGANVISCDYLSLQDSHVS